MQRCYSILYANWLQKLPSTQLLQLAGKCVLDGELSEVDLHQNGQMSWLASFSASNHHRIRVHWSWKAFGYWPCGKLAKFATRPLPRGTAQRGCMRLYAPHFFLQELLLRHGSRWDLKESACFLVKGAAQIPWFLWPLPASQCQVKSNDEHSQSQHWHFWAGHNFVEWPHTFIKLAHQSYILDLSKDDLSSSAQLAFFFLSEKSALFRLPVKENR